MTKKAPAMALFSLLPNVKSASHGEKSVVHDAFFVSDGA